MKKSNTPRYLLACDFDGTLFETYNPSPNNISIKKSYELALDAIFGSGIGQRYLRLFGLYSKAPTEIVKELLEWAKYNENWINKARDFFDREGPNIKDLIPEMQNNQLTWDETSPEKTISQILVGQKLRHLLEEIGKSGEDGQIWPQPCEDALIFLRTVDELKKEGVPIDMEIISSGHESFIRRTFDTYQLTQPDILVTEDDVRSRKYPTEMKRRVKPGQFPLALAHFKWLDEQGLIDYSVDGISVINEAASSKKRIIYFGDSIEKDFLMAKRGNIDSRLYPFTPWKVISETLVTKKHLLDGQPIEGFFPMPDDLRETKEISVVGLKHGQRA
ncbi:MAG: hypothetical protein HYW86_00920 [Candidatus Roizmanbacteria bacterium]|nr:MAG: hypothetical protein HYW86_00920 [Candidatus Roizmanbacteria bacterium]